MFKCMYRLTVRTHSIGHKVSKCQTHKKREPLDTLPNFDGLISPPKLIFTEFPTSPPTMTKDSTLHLTTALCYADVDAVSNQPLLPKEEKEASIDATLRSMHCLLVGAAVTGFLLSSLAIGPVTIILHIWGPVGSERHTPTATSVLVFFELISILVYMVYVLLFFLFSIGLTRRGASYFHKKLQLAKRWQISRDMALAFLFVSFFFGFALGACGWHMAAMRMGVSYMGGGSIMAVRTYANTVALFTVLVYWLVAVLMAGGILLYYDCYDEEEEDGVSLERSNPCSKIV
jgi:hypothetical protein